IDRIWKRLAPGVPLKREFADEVWGSTAHMLDVLMAGFGAIAALALANSALGLVGISNYAIARRMREIGVRKTLGASVRNLLAMLLKDAAKPVVLGNLVAWPIAFLAVRAYTALIGGAMQASLLPFLFGLGLTLAIAWLAVVGRATHAARLNPATVLR